MWCGFTTMDVPMLKIINYMCKTIRQDNKQKKLERIQKVWTEAIESGISDKTIDEIYEEALARHRKKNKK